MAIIRHLERQELEHVSQHTETNATYTIVQGSDGQSYLQVDTYGSASREFEGKKSQSIRFSSEAIAELKAIIDRHFRE